MIGVFDSGLGGLTILRALATRLPERNFLYLADHANAPYGNKSATEILGLTHANLDRLYRAGCRLAIIGCNTVSVVALRPVQRAWLPDRWPGRNALGILVPTVEAITGIKWDAAAAPDPSPIGTVAIFATARTVDSAVYPIEIAKRAPSLKVLQHPCPALAGQIESGASEDTLRHMIARYVGQLYARNGGADPDWVILGCTHYALVTDLFRAALPAHVPIVSQPQAVAEGLAVYLARHPEFDPAPRDPAAPRFPRCRFLTTGKAHIVTPLARRFIEEDYLFEETD
ncbi:MAG: aspartate/glutamate racemase family protein [Rhodospirillales bacterium]|nr:aspartate/glutamate racemase family protein [Rhodospirillales bacterium]